MRAVLTRDDDYFVPLAQRVQKARRVQADLFVSIHADAFSDADGARLVGVRAVGARRDQRRGALARAEARTQPDLIGGVNLDGRDPMLARTLLDLSQTAQINDSLKVGRTVLERHRRRSTRCTRATVEQAGFAVLKAPDIPSILVETAFISNPDEELKLRSDAPPAALRRVDRRAASSATSRRTRRSRARDRLVRVARGQSRAGRVSVHSPPDDPLLRPLPRAAGRAVRPGAHAVGAGLVRGALDQHARAHFAPASSRCSIRKSSRTARCCSATANGFAVSIEAGCNGVEATHRPARRDARVSGAVEAQARSASRRHRRGAGAQHRARDQPVLPRAVEPRRVRVGASVRLAGADHARRADRVAAVGAHAAARRRDPPMPPAAAGAVACGDPMARASARAAAAAPVGLHPRGARLAAADVRGLVLRGAAAAVAGRAARRASIARIGLRAISCAASSSIGAMLTFVDRRCDPGTRAGAAPCVSVDVNVLLFSFGLPLLAALILAAREPASAAQAG